MDDITCAHCGEPWDVYGLRHDGWEYLADQDRVPGQKDPYREHVALNHPFGEERQKAYRQRFSQAVYTAVLSGRGCPSRDCGFSHRKAGSHRLQQLRELVVDGVTDDDPMLFM